MKPRIVITRHQLDAVRDAGVPVTFTKPGRAIVAGIAVHIEDVQPPPTVLVCMDDGEGTWMECADCGASIVVHPSSPAAPVKICLRCLHARTQLAYHGHGPTFGELAIGECFYWPPPIPRGPEPMVKSADDRYQWSKGYGKAEAFYRVERWT